MLNLVIYKLILYINITDIIGNNCVIILLISDTKVFYVYKIFIWTLWSISAVKSLQALTKLIFWMCDCNGTINSVHTSSPHFSVSLSWFLSMMCGTACVYFLTCNFTSYCITFVPINIFQVLEIIILYDIYILSSSDKCPNVQLLLILIYVILIRIIYNVNDTPQLNSTFAECN